MKTYIFRTRAESPTYENFKHNGERDHLIEAKDIKQAFRIAEGKFKSNEQFKVTWRYIATV